MWTKIAVDDPSTSRDTWHEGLLPFSCLPVFTPHKPFECAGGRPRGLANGMLAKSTSMSPCSPRFVVVAAFFVVVADVVAAVVAAIFVVVANVMAAVVAAVVAAVMTNVIVFS